MRASSLWAAAATTAALTASPLTASAAGTVSGKVHFTGKAPKNLLIGMGADPNCVKINAGTKMYQELVTVNPDGTLANVYVAIKGNVPGAAIPSTPVVIEQEGCVYHPRMSGAMVGQTLRVVNKDATLHNIKGISEKRNRFNLGQAQAGMTFDFKLKDEEIVMLVRCEVHKWMLGYIGVATHPYFDVTRGEGTFTLRNVPAGTYTVEAWHERYGRYAKEVAVTDGGTATLDFTYTGEEPAPGFLIRDLIQQRP
jgi:plastocyanin